MARAMALFASLICSSKRRSINRVSLAMTVSQSFRCGRRGPATRDRHRKLMEVQLSVASYKRGSKVFPRNNGCPAACAQHPADRGAW